MCDFIDLNVRRWHPVMFYIYGNIQQKITLLFTCILETPLSNKGDSLEDDLSLTINPVTEINLQLVCCFI